MLSPNNEDRWNAGRHLVTAARSSVDNNVEKSNVHGQRNDDDDDVCLVHSSRRACQQNRDDYTITRAAAAADDDDDSLVVDRSHGHQSGVAVDSSHLPLTFSSRRHVHQHDVIRANGTD